MKYFKEIILISLSILVLLTGCTANNNLGDSGVYDIVNYSVSNNQASFSPDVGSWKFGSGDSTIPTSTVEIIGGLTVDKSTTTNATTTGSLHVGGDLSVMGDTTVIDIIQTNATSTGSIYATDDITASGNIAGANLSGTNTGDVTVSDGSTIDFTLTGQQITAETIDSAIDHDSLLNFVANEHIDWTGATNDFFTTGYASTTAGLFTQGNGHFGGTLSVDGNLGIGTDPSATHKVYISTNNQRALKLFDSDGDTLMNIGNTSLISWGNNNNLNIIGPNGSGIFIGRDVASGYYGFGQWYKSGFYASGGLAIGSITGSDWPTDPGANNLTVKGNVGIGDASPNDALDIYRDDSGEVSIHIANANTSGDASIIFDITSGNNFTIGAENLNNEFVVAYGDDTATDPVVRIQYNGDMLLDDNLYVGNDSGSDTDYLFYDAGIEYIRWNNSTVNFEISDDFSPALADGGALGTAAAEWQDLYFTPPSTASCLPKLILNSDNRVYARSTSGISVSWTNMESCAVTVTCGEITSYICP